MTLPPSIAHAIQNTQEWLKELSDNGELADSQESLAVLRAVLHRLRDRLTMEEAVDLGAQLPTMIRGIYYEGWQPSRTPTKVRSRQEFVGCVGKGVSERSASRAGHPRRLCAACRHCDPGEISDVIGQLPSELKSLWPKGAQTYRARTQ